MKSRSSCERERLSI